MRLEEHTDFSTLAWVKPEIDELLNQARQSLEAYVEDTNDPAAMRACADNLHQVAGTLRMVESYGATQLTAEMETLARALMGDQITERDTAYGALMRGLVQLPDYLDIVDVSRKDLAIVLLPLLNELRATRGAPPADASVVFYPALDAHLPADVAGARVPLPFADLRQRTLQLRTRLQPLQLAWTQGSKADFGAMGECFDGLLALSVSEPSRRLWWVAGGVLETLKQGRLDAQATSLCRQFAQIDRVIQQMGDEGEEACDSTDAREALRVLLFAVASALPGKGRGEAIARAFRLDRIAPTPEELDHARAAMSGRNRALLDTVAKAVREDLLRVKEGLDIFLRRDRRDAAELAPYIDALRRVGDTLSVLGLASSARSVAEQRGIVTDIVEGKREGRPETILDVASSLLYVDASLDMHIEALGYEAAEDAASNALPVAEARRIMRALLREAGANLAKVKADITAFIESAWAHEHLNDVPRLLGEVSGALRILNLDAPADVVGGIDRYVGNELLVDRRVPTVEEMDTLADAIAGVEYYLEIGRDASASDERILDSARGSLERLHYWPVPPVRDVAAATALATAATPAAHVEAKAVDEVAAPAPAQATPVEALAGTPAAEAAPVVPGVGPGKWVDVEEEVLEPVAGEQAAVDTSFQDAAGIDEEIREVFVEEVAEEISNIGTNLPAWKAHPEDLEALKNVRRSFHTLKGSGRLVGAMALGEFSWKIENMLNRVLDHTIQPEAHVLELVETAVAALPKLESGLKGQPVAIDPPLDAIMQTADKLAAGEMARVADFTQGYQKVMRTVRRWVPAEAPAPAAAEAPVPAALTSPESGLPVIDPILLDVLRTEVAQHVAGMRDYLARNANFDVPVDDDLVRAVHTLHGAIGMVGIEPLDAVLAPAEVWVRRVRSAGAPLDREASDALRDTAALTEHVLAQFETPTPDVPDTTALAERIHGLRDLWPEAVPASAAAHAAEMERLEAEQAEHERAAAAQAEHERAAAEQAEHERAAAAQAEHERAAAEQAEHERAAAEQAEHERAAAEQAEAERLAAEQAEHERAAAEQAEYDRAAAEQAEQERAAAEQAEQERLAAEQAEAERIAAEQAEAERIAAEQAEAERIAAEKAEAERIAAEQAEAERIAAEKAEAERIAAEQAEAERIAAEQAEAERIAAEKAEQERIAARRREAEVQLAKEALPAFPDDPQPEGALDSSLDMELVGLFTEEGNELLDESDRLLATLHGEPDNVDCVRGLQRNLHTIKGGARVVGLASIGDLGHAMETLLEKAGDRGGALEPVEMDALERGFDRLHDLVARVERGQAVAAPVNAIERFNALAEGRAVTAAAEPVVPTPVAAEPAAAVDEEMASAPIEAPGAADAIEPVAEEPVVAGEAEPVLAAADAAVEAERPAQPAPPPREAPKFAETEVRAPSELIRVRSDLLDSMVNAAGEVSIYRARLEQQVSSFRFNLVELDQTVSRLREQLRKLEIETETQILSRYQRENEGAEGATFDPLELDRFSNLQQYSRALAESVSDLASIQDILDDQTRKSETLLLQQSRVNSDLQDGLMRTRMVPFESLVPNLRRTLRGAADELGKRAQLRVEGAQGEMDRNVLERMKAPFEHMLRNALTHGIEDPAQRIALGKPAEGTVTIQVGREGTEVLVDVADDGSGFNRAAIREKAIQRGLLKADAKVSDSELLNFVLETGFSTAGEVSMLAGRGVGMDVVANEVRELGGSLSIESEEGRGTTFHIRLPFTLAVTQAITVRAGDATFAVPMTSIEAASRIRRTEMEQRIAGNDMTISHVGQDYHLYDLSQLLGMPSTAMVEDSAGHLPLLMVRQGDLRAAIRVDVVIGSREIVVKPVGPQISNVPGIFGATIMGDGSVMLILDLAPLVRRFAAKQAAAAEREAAIAAGMEVEAPVAPTPVEVPERAGPRLVMVVDDSITMRKVTTRVFERELMEVVTAKDGVDALEKLQERVPDVMLLDIEMPRMDGYELATHMKNDARFRNIPIIMITSRTGEKHRQRAFEIGVDRYLGKPYSEADLLQNVAELLEPVNG